VKVAKSIATESILIFAFYLLYYRIKKLSKSKSVFSETPRKYSQRRVPPVQDSIRKSVLVSRLLKPPLKEHTLTTNAHSPPILQLEEESSRVLFFPQR